MFCSCCSYSSCSFIELLLLLFVCLFVCLFVSFDFPLGLLILLMLFFFFFFHQTISFVLSFRLSSGFLLVLLFLCVVFSFPVVSGLSNRSAAFFQRPSRLTHSACTKCYFLSSFTPFVFHNSLFSKRRTLQARCSAVCQTVHIVTFLLVLHFFCL